jgi:hypothetical protein
MKIIGRVLGAIVLLIVLTAASLYIWGEPIRRMPGRHLHGTVVTQPVEDWSFAASPKGTLCQIEVDSDSPEAVNIACIGVLKNLYVGHMVRPNQRRSWAEVLALNLDSARIRFGKNIYPVRATPVTDPAERQRIWDTGYTVLHAQNGPASPPDSFLLFKLVSR